MVIDRSLNSGEKVYNDLKVIQEKQKVDFLADLPVSIEVRIDRLSRAVALLSDNASRINEAIQADWARPEIMTLLADVSDPIARLKYAIRYVRKWSKSRKYSPNFPFGLLGAKAHVSYRPVGVVGIISPWNAPIMLSFGPLAACFAAGNRAMMKLSEFNPTLSELLKSLVSQYFEEQELAIITGGPDVAAAFTGIPFDHLVFTGNPQIAKQVMRSAADNLTPITLELGGKSPVVIGPDANIELAATRIMSGKLLNAGQICVSPDYLFIEEDKLEQFVSVAKQVMNDQYPAMNENPDYCEIINQNHFERLNGYLEDACNKHVEVITINPGQMSDSDSRYKLSVSLLINPPDNSLVMQEEIFGPLLPIITYTKVEEIINHIRLKPSPLALYYFGSDTVFRRNVLDRTLVGDVTINDVLFHSSQVALPFGGVGASGNGSCYGIEGFYRMSHATSIYQQSPIEAVFKMLRPPYGDKALNAVKMMTRK